MSETLAHTRLVGVIVDYVKAEYSATPGFCLFCDCPPVLETEKPWPIEGVFPDVCAKSSPPTLTVIGEAKTSPDLESPRSYKQFLAFLRYLAARPNPTLIIATPWRNTATAKNIIRLAKLEASTEEVAVRFLNEQGKQC